MSLKAPFPWFGGKSSIAPVIWERFGKVQNYVEPFFGSGAVLLARPAPLSTETVNDADGFLCNFWRALQAEPDGVARWADWPVNEADLHARHYWLVTEGAARVAAVIGKPDGYDAQVAGWWVWGICAFIGGGFCSGSGPWQWQGDQWGKKEKGEAGVPIKIPHMGDAGQGINRKLPHMGNGQGINRKLPHMGDAGRGINRALPHMGNAGQGINRALPHMGDAGQGIADMFAALSQRLRSVRVAHGDWTRVCGDSVTWRHGKTAVFLDPPYDGYEGLYTEGVASISTAVREWAVEAGKRKDMLICLAGYADEHTLPDGWTVHRWKARGGFGSQGDKQGRENSALETLWFSPACNPPRQETLI